MSLYSASGARPPASPTVPALPQAAARQAGALVPASGKLAPQLPVVDPVPAQEDLVSLSSQGIEARGIERTVSTSESAQNLIGSIARNMFGGDTSTGSVSYNVSSYQQRTAEAGAAVVERAPRTETLTLREDASFYGVGEIVTRDGERFDFKATVKYESNAEEGELRSRTTAIELPDVLVLTGKPLPAIEFPGGLQDLFKLLSRELRTNVTDGESNGSLTMRLIRLVDQAALLAPRVRPDSPEANPAERARAVASAYSGPSASESTSA